MARRAEQHRGVPVMAAGMHLARNSGYVVVIALFLHWQRIHVSPQQDGLAGAVLAVEHADNAGLPDARLDCIQPPGAQFSATTPAVRCSS